MSGIYSMIASAYQYGVDTETRYANMGEAAKAARRSRFAAVDSLNQGSILAGQAKMRGSALAAKQRVAYANSGIDASVGTAADVIASTGIMSEFDALTIENNAVRAALGHTLTAERYLAQIDQLKRDQRAAGVATALNVMGGSISV